jgi:hypothetical protein
MRTYLSKILTRDLSSISTEEQSVGGWLNFYGNSETMKDVKGTLLFLEQELVDTNLYLRHLVTQYDINVGVTLLDTFH